MNDLWTAGLDRPERTKREDGKKTPFLNLREYDSSWRVRVVSEQPTPYFCHFTQNAQGKTVKVNCSGDENCPVPVETTKGPCKGTQAQRRFYIKVLDRADGVIKVLDVGKSIVNGIGQLHKDEDWGHSKEYDIKITKGPRGSQPANLYSVLPTKLSPLTPEELALVENSNNPDHEDFIDIESRAKPLPAETIAKILGLEVEVSTEETSEATSSSDDGEFNVDWDE